MNEEKNSVQGNTQNIPEKDIPLPLDDKPETPKKQVIDSKTGEVIERRQAPIEKKNVAIQNNEQQTIVPATPFQKLLYSKKNALENFLGNEKNALRFMSSVVHCMQKVPELMNCNEGSLMSAFMECAAIGLYPGNASGDCYVLPYKGKAQFQLGYKGIKTLAYRSGVLSMWAEIRFSKDKFKQVLGTNPQIMHEPFDDDDENRGEPIGAYACAEVAPGKIIFKYLSKSKIMKIKALSPSKNSEYSPWNSATDVDLWMWKKCAIKQLGKMMPQSDQMKRAVYLDNASERGGFIEADGEVIEESFMSNDQKIDSVKDRKDAMRKAKK